MAKVDLGMFGEKQGMFTGAGVKKGHIILRFEVEDAGHIPITLTLEESREIYEKLGNGIKVLEKNPETK